MLTVSASTGGSYVVFEGDSLMLDASNSSTTATAITQLEWDLDNDAEFDDLTLTIDNPEDLSQYTHTLTWNDLVNLGIADSSLFLYTIGVRATDNLGATGEDFTDVFVVNVDPVLGDASYVQVGDGGGGCGGGEIGVVEFTATFVDHGVNELYDIDINWGGTGTPVAGPTYSSNGNGSYTITASYAYDAATTYEIAWSVSDGEGLPVEDTLPDVNVLGGGSEGSAVLDGTALVITGTCGNDLVYLSTNGGLLSVQAGFLPAPNFTATFSLGAVTEIRALLGEGNDIFTVAGNISLPTIVAGGDGNDFLMGGRGLNVLIGGDGSDMLFGGQGEDALIGGATVHDNHSAALGALLADWTADHILPPTFTAEIIDDDDSDVLHGGQDIDWLFFDQILDSALAARRDVIVYV